MINSSFVYYTTEKEKGATGGTMIPVWTKEEVLPATAASESAMAGRTS